MTSLAADTTRPVSFTYYPKSYTVQLPVSVHDTGSFSGTYSGIISGSYTLSASNATFRYTTGSSTVSLDVDTLLDAELIPDDFFAFVETRTPPSSVLGLNYKSYSIGSYPSTGGYFNGSITNSNVSLGVSSDGSRQCFIVGGYVGVPASSFLSASLAGTSTQSYDITLPSSSGSGSINFPTNNGSITLNSSGSFSGSYVGTRQVNIRIFFTDLPSDLVVGTKYDVTFAINLNSSLVDMPDAFGYLAESPNTKSVSYSPNSSWSYNSNYHFLSGTITGFIANEQLSNMFISILWDVPAGTSFTINSGSSGIPSGSICYLSFTPTDSTIIQDQLSNADGGNTEFNLTNDTLSTEFGNYSSATDTTTQYNSIGKVDLTPPTSIFQSVASTLSLFATCVSGIWSAIGDFSTILQIFLTFSVVSLILGITNHYVSFNRSNRKDKGDKGGDG